ncbi:MAG: tetratricopeptide repeat protein [Pseudomonadota bacterium]
MTLDPDARQAKDNAGASAGRASWISRWGRELLRRKVHRALAIYLGIGWAVTEVASAAVGALGWPPNWADWLVLAFVSGFPLVIVASWFLDGLHRDRSSAPRAFFWSAIGGGAVLSAITLMLLTRPFSSSPGTDAETPGPAAKNSIAVLAFENLGEESGDYFGRALAEEILALLARIPQLQVVSRTSSFQFRGQQIDIREVAKRLGATHLLEGSARRDSGRVRVISQFIDGSSGYGVWTATYERPIDDLFAIQREIAAAVVRGLKLTLLIEAEDELRASRTQDTEAYVYYLEGVGRLRSSIDADVMRVASELFRSALDLDPEFARAFAGLCETHLRLFEIARAASDFTSAEQACSRAEELEPGIGTEIQLALGKLYRTQGSLEKAAQALKSAIAAEPGEPDAYLELGKVRAEQEQIDEAEALLLRAADLKRNYWRTQEALGSFYYRGERYEEAAAAYDTAAKLAPDVASVFGGQGAVYWMLGEKEKAVAAYETSLALKPTRQGYTNLGLRLYYDGRFGEAAAMQQKALALAPDDHRLWGRLAESYRFTPGSEALAQDAYLRAAEQARVNLEINSSDWRTQGLLGLYLAHLGRPEEARARIEQSISLSSRDAEALYYSALVDLHFGNQDRALEALEEAIVTDPLYVQIIEGDPDLVALSSDERFMALVRPRP